ncbi:MAG: DUF4286 family protein [Pseudomonadota bacterium]
MRLNPQVVYEVSLRVPATREAEMSGWLPGHVQRMLELPGFIEAQRFNATSEDDGTLVFTVQYLMRDQQALDTYLLEHADPMRREGRELFGNDLDANRSVRTLAGQETTACLNCGVTLDGQYCWNCGQRNRDRVITLREVLKDGFDELFDWDSRLWRSFRPLLLKPGFLTSEYLRGRRVRYVPPFRTYLVLSFLFFLIVQLTNAANVDFEGADAEQAAAELDAAADRIEGENPQTAEQLRQQSARLRGEDSSNEAESAEDADDSDSEAVDQAGDAADNEDDDFVNVGISFDSRENGSGDCDMNLDLGIPLLQRFLTPEHQQAVCEDLIATRGEKLFERMQQSAPVAALMLLPLMALLMTLLYPRSRRYYVEHLLFLIHYHAFTFLGWALLMVLGYCATLLGVPDAAMAVIGVLVGVYIWLYLYRAMRRVYQQPHWATIPKFLILNVGYIASFFFLLLGVLIYIVITY